MDLDLDRWRDGGSRLGIAWLHVVDQLRSRSHRDVESCGGGQCITSSRGIQRIARSYLIYGYITESRHTASGRYR